MLTSHVNRYLKERNNFNTQVCQYNNREDLELSSFGGGLSQVEPSEHNLELANAIKFPKRRQQHRHSQQRIKMNTASAVTQMNGTMTDNEYQTQATSAEPPQRGFGLNLGNCQRVEKSLETALVVGKRSIGGNHVKTASGNYLNNYKHASAGYLDGSVKVTTAQPKSRLQLKKLQNKDYNDTIHSVAYDLDDLQK